MESLWLVAELGVLCSSRGEKVSIESCHLQQYDLCEVAVWRNILHQNINSKKTPILVYINFYAGTSSCYVGWLERKHDLNKEEEEKKKLRKNSPGIDALEYKDDHKLVRYSLEECHSLEKSDIRMRP